MCTERIGKDSRIPFLCRHGYDLSAKFQHSSRPRGRYIGITDVPETFFIARPNAKKVSGHSDSQLLAMGRIQVENMQMGGLFVDNLPPSS